MVVHIPHGKGQVLGKGMPIVKYMLWAVQKAAESIDLLFGLWKWGGPKEAQVQSYSPVCVDVHSFNRICQVVPMYPMTLRHKLCRNGWTDRFDHLLYLLTQLQTKQNGYCVVVTLFLFSFKKIVIYIAVICSNSFYGCQVDALINALKVICNGFSQIWWKSSF